MPVTVHTLLKRAESYLKDCGVGDARHSSEELLRYVLKLSKRAELFLYPAELSRARVTRYVAAIRKRGTRYPLQYIIGTVGFRDCELIVTEDVLIPRPETEVLVGYVLDFVRKRPKPRILDVGTGSGAIAVSIAEECQDAHVTAIDSSFRALSIAEKNVINNKVSERVRLVAGDLLSPLVRDETFDCIVSNPPYIAEQEYAALEPELRHEPRSALLEGGDGLSYYKRISEHARGFLKPKGMLAFEIGQAQGKAVAEIMHSYRFSEVTIYPDLTGRDRICVGYRQ
jgi:release factor glutamine methyltransferase